MHQHKLQMSINMEISLETQTVYMDAISPNVLLHQILMSRRNLFSIIIQRVCATKPFRKSQLMS